LQDERAFDEVVERVDLRGADLLDQLLPADIAPQLRHDRLHVVAHFM